MADTSGDQQTETRPGGSSEARGGKRRPSPPLFQLLGPPISAFVLILVVEWFARAGSQPLLSPTPLVQEFFRDLLTWPVTSPVAFTVNYCLALGLTWLGAAIFGRARWGILVAWLLLLALAVVNRTKLIYMDAAVSPRDLAVAWYGARFMLAGAPGWFWLVPPLTVVGAWLGLRWLRRHIHSAGLSAANRVLLACAALTLLGGFTAFAAAPLWAAGNTSEPSTRDGRPVTKSEYYEGLVLSMTARAALRTPDPSPDYTEKRIESICERFMAPAPAASAPATAPARPSIIFWLSESFWDVNAIPGVNATPDPLVNYRRLAQEGRAFPLLVPGYGGPTSATMYEVLTGISLRFAPQGMDGYNDLVKQRTPSIAWLLRTQGYDTLAIHADWGRCFRSSEVYSLLGFDRYEYEVNFPDAPRRGMFVSDEFLTDHVIEKIESSDRPMLIFAASMQGHGPYIPDAYSHYDVEIAPGIAKPERLELRTYAQHMREADAALARLTDHFRKSSRPVVLVFFGDHLPPFGSTFGKLGYIDIGHDTALTQRVVQHTTPGLIWTNTQLPLPQITTPISGTMLSMHTLGMMGVEHPFYTGILSQVRRAYPGICPRVYVRYDGQLEPPHASDPVVHEYELICYDTLFGQHFGRARLFPEVPLQ